MHFKGSPQVLASLSMHQQFCNNKKKTHYLFNHPRDEGCLLTSIWLRFFTFQKVTFCGLPQGNVGISAGLDIAFNAPWRRVFYPVSVACQSNGVIIPVSSNILAEKPSLSVIPVVTHIVQFISECFITLLPRPSKAHTLI